MIEKPSEVRQGRLLRFGLDPIPGGARLTDRTLEQLLQSGFGGVG
ncbi:MAG: hypothetical protein V9G98_04045 [Candidatus Competibacter sp.]